MIGFPPPMKKSNHQLIEGVNRELLSPAVTWYYDFNIS